MMVTAAQRNDFNPLSERRSPLQMIAVDGSVTIDRRNHSTRPKLTRGRMRMKRAVDISVASAVLTVASPVMAAVAVAVRATSRGPIIFRQTRVGRDGRPFKMLKFRTMLNGTDELVRRNPELWALYVANDHKLPDGVAMYTPIGAALRKLSLDELPQLINVLRGEMSLVGIRPIERTQLDQRCQSSQRLYGLMAPGLTGLWQVNGRSTVTDADRVELDNSYVRTWNLKQDLSLLVKTPVAVLKVDTSH
jgi:exopolysaccharide production protein ExoY